MRSAATDPRTKRAKDGISRQERFELYSRAFLSVTQVYREIRELPLITAFSLDPDERGGEKLTPLGIEFCVDIENATKKALENNPELLKVWMQLVRDDAAADEKLERRVIWQCGKMYVARKLRPGQYFRINRYPTRSAA
jgi:hypothetical protein